MQYRKHIRLNNYDYSSPNYYFIMICTRQRKKMFVPRLSKKYGNKLNVANTVAASPWLASKIFYTNIIEDKLLLLEKKFFLEIDFYCIMSNHLHIIIAIQARQGRAATNLAWIINAYKGWCTKAIGKSVFQPNYYEHIIRSENSLDRIRSYIVNNPCIEYNSIPWKLIDPNKV